MSRQRQYHSMTVTVSAPSAMSPAQVRREVRSLINEQCNYLSVAPDGEDVIIRVSEVRSALKRRPRTKPERRA